MKYTMVHIGESLTFEFGNGHYVSYPFSSLFPDVVTLDRVKCYGVKIPHAIPIFVAPRHLPKRLNHLHCGKIYMNYKTYEHLAAVRTNQQGKEL